MSETDDVKRPWDDGADFYSTSEQKKHLTREHITHEHLTHEDIDECLKDHFENTPGRVTEVAKKGVTIYAWKRMAIDVDAEAKIHLKIFVQNLAESIADEYGDQEGKWKGGIATKDAEAFKASVLPALVKLIKTVKPWVCSHVGEKKFTADELLAWVREHNPEWLEGKP